jgi:hypothetical protein
MKAIHGGKSKNDQIDAAKIARLLLVLLYEIHDIRRFPEVGNFLSYARLVRCAHESGGKKRGSGGKKIGNPHLRWAFAEAACLFLRQSERAKKWLQRQEKKRGKGKALASLCCRGDGSDNALSMETSAAQQQLGDHAGPARGAGGRTGAHHGRARLRRRPDEKSRGAPTPQVSLRHCS